MTEEEREERRGGRRPGAGRPATRGPGKTHGVYLADEDWVWLQKEAKRQKVRGPSAVIAEWIRRARKK